MILHDFGIDVSEAQLTYDAATNGWLDGGTSMNDMGKLLEYHGVPTHTNYNGDLPSLVNELSHGRKVIVAVDSTELWNGTSFWQRLTGWDNNAPDHAIVVSGIDFSDPNNPQVIVNDPGRPDGGGMQYPLKHFLEAWNDSNCAYVATDNAPPDLATHSQFGSNFNMQSAMYSDSNFWIGLVGEVAGITSAFATACLFEEIAPEVAITNPEFINSVSLVVGKVTNEFISDALQTVVNENNYMPILESLDDNARNQLFVEI
jgi:hypothetical protein